MSLINNKKNLFIFISSCFLLSVSSMLSYAAESLPTELPSKEPIVVNGDKVEYFHEQKKVVGNGNISITYKDVILTCDQVTVYLDTREAIAEGNVKVDQKGAYVTGDRMNYNFDTKKGIILKAYINAKPFYGKAGEAEKVAYKNQFNLQRGYVTTCDLDKPHYRVQAKEVRVYPGDKIVAKHIFLYVANVPVLYFPYYVQSLKERKSHITVMPGEQSDWGYFVLTSMRYHIDDKNKGDILLDYRSKKGLAEGINHYYHSDQLGDGAVKFYYTHENDMLAYTKEGLERSRYRWQVRHRWDMGEDTDTLMTFELNKMSDKDVVKDYVYNEYEELGNDPDNYISFITQKQGYSTEFLMRTRIDNFQTVVERLPEFSISIPDYNIIKGLPVYHRANASASYLNAQFDNTLNPAKQSYASGRVDYYNRLSYTARLFRALNVTPYAALENTYYSRRTADVTNVIRNVFSAGIDNSIKFYKVYDVTTNALGLNINKLRHIITPTANYYYVHDPTIAPGKLYQFDPIDALNKRNGILFGLENRLQTKRLDGDQMQSVDLATLLISSNYTFELKKHSLDFKNQKFQSIDFRLELVPYSWAYLQSTMSINTKRYEVETASIDLVTSGGDKWDLASSLRYEKTELAESCLATLDGAYRINDKWKFRLYERYNISKRAFEEQEYTIYRDLHCWVFELIYDIKSLDEQTLWFVFRLKAFPDYPIGVRRTYSRPRFGEVGEH